ncbi:MAG: VOC family protein [Rhodospirillaceae bacterium]|jgi:catechol 2,3-dioxygenase-like lactoylglutathione lyase family enzyme|nr:VOC family protein [Rhodospirillaceae bacterium]MBT4043253.1 VOC family protein [Rhodospirillaceae bacterium]MBT4689978.1 VOC family protein [Rhodospirillaceae bacterium]MBT5083748.1 VOC family protein [Rhodospirillaceae bacterium]MBT5525348.1 VOC family protein [Rhodospirillaceae bacterium]
MSDQKPRFAWGHINVNVTNLERSIAFYEKLGFELFRPGIPYLGLTVEGGHNTMPQTSARALGLDTEIEGRACIMQLGTGYPKLDLTEFAATDAARAKPLLNDDLGLVRICLASRDLVKDHAELSAQGVAFLSPPQPCKDGMADIAICMDPDGSLIELIQIHPENWASPPKI